MPDDGGVIGGETWIPAVAGETRIFRPSAGVTQRANVQIQNTTGYDLYLSDGERAPGDAMNAKFTVPPQATANFPLESSVMAAKWTGLGPVSIGERISVVFTDGPPVTPAVYPGVTPTRSPSRPDTFVQAIGGVTVPSQSNITILAANSVYSIDYMYLSIDIDAGASATSRIQAFGPIVPLLWATGSGPCTHEAQREKPGIILATSVPLAVILEVTAVAGTLRHTSAVVAFTKLQ